MESTVTRPKDMKATPKDTHKVSAPKHAPKTEEEKRAFLEAQIDEHRALYDHLAG
jgi:hypothetical protein